MGVYFPAKIGSPASIDVIKINLGRKCKGDMGKTLSAYAESVAKTW